MGPAVEGSRARIRGEHQVVGWGLRLSLWRLGAAVGWASATASVRCEVGTVAANHHMTAL